MGKSSVSGPCLIAMLNDLSSIAWFVEEIADYGLATDWKFWDWSDCNILHGNLVCLPFFVLSIWRI